VNDRQSQTPNPHDTRRTGPHRQTYAGAGKATRRTPCICGGPDVEDAIAGLANMIRADLEEFFEPDSRFELEVRMMTDWEVDQLEDI